jgi:hypothetical protein
VGRFHAKISLLYEMLGQLSVVVGPNTKIDSGGQDYITRQERFGIEQGNNAVEMMAAGMMRDSLYMIESGDDILPSFTAPTAQQSGFPIPFLVPAGNKNQLNMLGAGNIIQVSWDNPSAPIHGNLLAVIDAMAQLTRYTLTDIWISVLMWNNIVTNTEIRNLAGSAATPFAELYDELEDAGMESSGPANRYLAVLRALPFINWHFISDTLALNTDIDPVYSTATQAFPAAALAKEVPDNMAIFCHEPSALWQKLYLGGEFVVENPGQQAALRMGWHAWHEYATQPSAVELIFLLNAVPALFIPKIIAPAVVTGFAGG